MAYPKIVDFSFSSSGVVNAILDYTAFDTAVAEALDLYDGEGGKGSCSRRLRAVTAALEAAFEEAGGAGKDATKRLFNATNLVGTPEGDNDFWYMAADAAAMADQYGHKVRLCQALEQMEEEADAAAAKNASATATTTTGGGGGSGGSSPSSSGNKNNNNNTSNIVKNKALVAGFAAWVGEYWGVDFASGCFYDSECVKNATYIPGAAGFGVGARSWRWEKCHEVGYLQAAPKGDAEGGTTEAATTTTTTTTTTTPASLRSRHLTLEALLAQCEYVFGAAAAKPDTAALNAKFGGARPGTPSGGLATRIFFTDYSDDPWKTASVTRAVSPALPYCLTTCDGCGHCGAGVPANLTHCSDEADRTLSEWMARAQEEIAAAGGGGGGGGGGANGSSPAGGGGGQSKPAAGGATGGGGDGDAGLSGGAVAGIVLGVCIPLVALAAFVVRRVIKRRADGDFGGSSDDGGGGLLGPLVLLASRVGGDSDSSRYL